MDFNLIEKNNFANQEFTKNLRQSNMKSGQDSKLRQTMRTTMRAVKLTQSMRKQKEPVCVNLILIIMEEVGLLQ